MHTARTSFFARVFCPRAAHLGRRSGRSAFPEASSRRVGRRGQELQGLRGGCGCGGCQELHARPRVAATDLKRSARSTGAGGSSRACLASRKLSKCTRSRGATALVIGGLTWPDAPRGTAAHLCTMSWRVLEGRMVKTAPQCDVRRSRRRTERSSPTRATPTPWSRALSLA